MGRTRLAAMSMASGLIASAALLAAAPAASAIDYTDDLLTAQQAQRATKYDGTFERRVGDSGDNGNYASYFDQADPTAVPSYSLYVYKYEPPKPSDAKPPKPDPDAPKFECKSYESSRTKYTSVCWSKTAVYASSGTMSGKTRVSASVNVTKYDANGQLKPVKVSAKDRDTMAEQAQALRDAQVRKLNR